MYSKAGKATTEAFTVLQHGNEIFEQRGRNFRVAFTPQGMSTNDKLAELASKKFGHNNLMKDLIGILDDDAVAKMNKSSKPQVKSAKDIKKFEPFSTAVSRDYRDKILSHKTVSSNAAYYTPKYDQIEKKEHTLVNYSKGSTKRMFDEIVSATTAKSLTSPTDMDIIPMSELVRARVKGVIPLDLQAPRPDMIKQIEKRKICLTDALPNPDLPSALGSIPRLPRIKFSRSMPRKDMSIDTAAVNCPQYNPNHEFVKKSLGHVGAKFDRTTGRRELARVPAYTNETVYDYDGYVKKNRSHIFAKVKYPTFDKMMPRDRDRERHGGSRYVDYTTLNTKVSEPTFTKMSDYTERTKSYINQNSYEHSVL